MAGDRIEQRLRLRAEPWLSAATVLVRGGPGTEDKLARHAHRTARAWSFDGQPLPGILVFAVLDISLGELLSARLPPARMIHLPTAARLLDRGFELLLTGLRPHYTVRLRRADNAEFGSRPCPLPATPPLGVISSDGSRCSCTPPRTAAGFSVTPESRPADRSRL